MLEFGLLGRKIYFLELNWKNLPLLLLFRIVGIHVFFLTTTKFWQTGARLKQLNSLGIIWINCQEININNGSSFLVKANELREGVRLYLSQKDIFHNLSRQIRLQDCEKESLSTVLVKCLDSKILLLAQLFVCVEFLEGEATKDCRLWIANDIISRSILDKEGRWINLCPRWLSTLNFIGYGLNRICAIAFRQMKIVNQLKSFITNHTKQNAKVNAADDTHLSDYNIIYFPHKGIYYGNMFKKDHFYSSKTDNHFCPSKILHFSSSEDPKLNKSSLDYYKANDIPNADWAEVPGITNKKLILMSYFFVKKYLQTISRELDLFLIVICLLNYIRIKDSLYKLEQFTKLRIVLVGYDMLFPSHLALACRIKKIKTVAVQERMLPLWFFSPFLLDHYFVYGPASKEILEERFKSLIKNIYEIGPIRLGKHYECIEKSPEYKKQLPDYKYIVLVLDTHSEADFYKNGRRIGHNWNNILRFYQDVLSLCTVFPQAYFMIKGKNFDFIKIPYFSEVVSQLNKTTNCVIVKDYVKWTPFTSVSVSDIAIALHTSLGDEMLALGKPVIFYDLFAFPSKIFDYGSEIISFNFDDLKLKLTKFFENPDKYNQNLDSLRKVCFNISNETPKQLLDKELIKIYNN
jgi:hypothetical protein